METTVLKPEYEAFAQGLALGKSNSDAYKGAYNTTKMKPSQIHERSCRLAANPKILTRVSELSVKTKQIAESKFEITATEMLGKLVNLLNADIADYFEVKNVVTKSTTKAGRTTTTKRRQLVLKDLTKLTKEQRACIESVKEGPHGPEIKLFGKLIVIEKINRHIGFYKEDPEEKKKIYTSPEERKNRAIELVKKAKELAEAKKAQKPADQ